MTPSQAAKSAGLKSLAEMSELTGYDRHTLAQWHKSRPVVFDALLMWCNAKKEGLK